MERGRVLPLLTTATAVSSVSVKGKTCTSDFGDEHGPHVIGNREGLFSVAKMLHNDLWIGAED